MLNRNSSETLETTMGMETTFHPPTNPLANHNIDGNKSQENKIQH